MPKLPEGTDCKKVFTKFQVIICAGKAMGKGYSLPFPDDWFDRSPTQVFDYLDEIKAKFAAIHNIDTGDICISCKE